MKKLLVHFFLLPAAFILLSCGSSEETTKQETENTDSVYVFDEVPQDTLIIKHAEEPVIFPPQKPEKYYLVQIGAFTSKDKAEEFSEMCREKLNHEIIVIYSNDVNLFVVQLTELFPSRESAEKVRGKLWGMKDFKDAWILTIIR